MSEDTDSKLNTTWENETEGQLSEAGRKTLSFSKTQQELKRNFYMKQENHLKSKLLSKVLKSPFF